MKSYENKAPHVEVFLGPGGVGKTTLSAAHGLQWCEKYKNKSCKLITIDPSKRLKDLFNMDLLESEAVFDENLYVSLNQRKKIFNQFLKDSLKGDYKVEDFQSKILKALLDDLAVAQEFTSFYELYNSFHSNKYDHIIIDTPPLQNTSDFMESVNKLEKLFSSKVLDLFLAKEEKNIFYKIIFKSREVAFRVLKNLTGSDFIHELEKFFILTEQLRESILHVIYETKKILENHSSFYLVCNYNELSLKALKVSHAKLKEKNEVGMKGVFVNNFDKSFETKSMIKDFEGLKEEIQMWSIARTEKDLSQSENLKSLKWNEV